MDKRETNIVHDIKKKIICKFSLFKKRFKANIIPRDCFSHED